MENEISVISGQIQEILINPSIYESAQNWSNKHAYFMQSAMDNTMSPIIWMAAYNQYMQEHGDHERAIKQADGVIRKTQGTTLAEDVSRFETGQAWARMFTQFMGYFNMQANLLGTEFAKIMQDGGVRQGMGRGIYVTMLALIAPAVVGEAIRQAFVGAPEDEDDDGSWLDEWLAQVFGMSIVRNVTAMVPVVGQTAMALINASNDKPYDDRIQTSPAISMVERAGKAPFTAYGAVFDDKKKYQAVRDVGTLISMTTGLPGTFVSRPVSYAVGVQAGEIVPDGPIDFARGMITGTPSPESKQ
jgi:hypothetical protein